MMHVASIVVCVFSICVAVRLMILVQRTDGVAKRAHLTLTILLLGAAIWMAQMTFFCHLIVGQPHQFDFIRVISGFVLASSGVGVALWVSSVPRGIWVNLACGAIFGLTAAATFLFAMTTASLSVLDGLFFGHIIGITALSVVMGMITFYALLKYALVVFWHSFCLAFSATILLPQSLATILNLGPPRPYIGDLFVTISPSTMFTILTATLAVFLLWSVAAFVTEAHHTSVRQSLLRDATLLDPLTDLPNRLRLEQHFSALRSQSARGYLHPAAILMFNIDGFKSINELHSNRYGDHVLKEIAYRLSLQSSDREFVARIGGDEFVIVLNHVSEPQYVEDIAKEMLLRINQPITVGQTMVRSTASVGYALLPQDGQSFDELMVKAEVALKRSKVNASKKVERFDREMDHQERAKSAMLQQLGSAADRGELFLHYQMQHDIQTEELCGFEVLVRWEHPEQGLISPVVFIPLAEQSGLIRYIGAWVLKTACAEAASWHRPYSIAVNVAPQQLLEAGFFDMVQATLETTGLPASRLELEITEASIIEDEEATLDVMHRLRGLGIRIAMDDFGTGYSSLAMLQAFPFDKIKIDRSFVIDVHENPDRAAIIQATVLIGEAMAIPVLVEGVESREELTFLRRAKCHTVQGFIFGKPLDTQAVRKLAMIPDEFRVAYR